jgi:3'-phosphoadenosine 5'-phosphosulfate (PAPS) 3'-phosphatase
VVTDCDDRRGFAEELAVEAGQLALSYRYDDDLEIRSKGVLDWVTEADLATEHLIRSRISAAYPDDRVMGEEGENDGDPNGTKAAGWGTSRLVARRQEAAVLLCGPASVDDEHVTRDHGSRWRR